MRCPSSKHIVYGGYHFVIKKILCWSYRHFKQGDSISHRLVFIEKKKKAKAMVPVVHPDFGFVLPFRIQFWFIWCISLLSS
jgi:hypothetical protein